MKLAIIDLSHALHRVLNVEEIVKMRDAQGRHSGGVYGVSKILSTIMQNYPDHLPVMVSDKGLCSRRLELYPNYKRCADKLAEQSIPDEQLTTEELKVRQDGIEFRDMYRNSKAYIKELCNTVGIPHIEIEGFEGDDLAAVLVQSDRITDAVLVTDDADWKQILDLNKNIPIELFRAMRKEKINQELFYQEEKSIDRFALIKSTTGDGSDNIPQLAKGVGGGFASKFFDCLLESYSYDEILRWKAITLKEDETVESKYTSEDMVDIERTNEMRKNLVEKFGTGKKITSFIEALDTTNTLQINAGLIDLRLIDDNTFNTTMTAFNEEMDKIKDKQVTIFEILGAFGQFQISNIDAIGLNKQLNQLRKTL